MSWSQTGKRYKFWLEAYWAHTHIILMSNKTEGKESGKNNIRNLLGLKQVLLEM